MFSSGEDWSNCFHSYLDSLLISTPVFGMDVSASINRMRTRILRFRVGDSVSGRGEFVPLAVQLKSNYNARLQPIFCNIHDHYIEAFDSTLGRTEESYLEHKRVPSQRDTRMTYHSEASPSVVHYRNANDVEFIIDQEYQMAFGQSAPYRVWNTVSGLNLETYLPLLLDRLNKAFADNGFIVTEKMTNFNFIRLSSNVTSDEEDDRDDGFVERVYILNHDTFPCTMSILTGFAESIRVAIFTNTQDHALVDVWNEVKQLAKAHTKQRKKDKAKIHIITRNSSGLDLRDFNVAPLDSIDTFVDDHYNDDFRETNDVIIEKIRKSNKGITLLHGLPGTGKTNYIRYLANMIGDKRLIYIPPELTSVLSSPEFIDFVMEYKGSVFVVEDAENVLLTREAGASSAVTNILNMSDGIIGDAVQCQFVCTFNCDFDMIDPALKRKGRLNASYCFDKLSTEKSTTLLKAVHGEEYVANEPMTLAEIYNFNDKDFGKLVTKQTRRIGF